MAVETREDEDQEEEVNRLDVQVGDGALAGLNPGSVDQEEEGGKEQVDESEVAGEALAELGVDFTGGLRIAKAVWRQGPRQRTRSVSGDGSTCSVHRRGSTAVRC